MTSHNDISTLEERLANIARSIAELKKQIGCLGTSAGDDDDDMYHCYGDENSPYSAHLQNLLSRIDELRRERGDCESMLRAAGVSVPIRDDDD